MLQEQTRAKDSIKQLIQTGNFNEAQSALSEYAREYGRDTVYLLFQAIIALEKEDILEAEEYLFSAHQIAPDQFEVLFLLGNLYERKEDFPYALEWYRKARKVANPEQLRKIEAIPRRMEHPEASLAPEREKLIVFVKSGMDQFLNDLIVGLQRHYEVEKLVIDNLNQIEPAMKRADLCWFEWCDELIIHASNLDIAKKKPIVCRLHRFEVFTPMPNQVKWECVDSLILVADHLITILRNTVPGIEDRVEVTVVQNGVDVDAIRFIPRSPGYNIATVGFIHMRKNPMLLLQIMAKLVRFDPRYKLFVAGQFQDPLVRMYWDHMINELGLQQNIFFEGWQKDVPRWLEDKQFLISTSMHESFGYSIGEAMTAGLKPVVHNFPFATRIWPEQILFNTVDEAVGMITSTVYDSQAYHNFIEQHYSIFDQITQLRKVLSNLPKANEESPVAPMFKKGALKSSISDLKSATLAAPQATPI